MRHWLRKLLLGFGYRVDCIRYLPSRLVETESELKLDFHSAVCRLMVEMGQSLRFIQIGAFDGETGDPILRYIRRNHWRGILVEPQRDASEKLTRLHAGNSDIQIVNAAIGERRGVGTLYTVEGEHLPNWSGGLASFSKISILKHQNQIPNLETLIKPETVAIIPFSELLETGNLGSIDVLQIDTEGADAEILRMFPFDQMRPSIVHWEVKHLSKSELDKCLDRLASYGYRFARSGGEDMLALIPP